VAVNVLPHGHELGLEDVELAKQWAKTLSTGGLA